MQQPTSPKSHTPNPLLKLALELGPLVAFFLANQRGDIYLATAIFMGAMLISLIATKLIFKTLPIMPMVSGLVVLIFGGLTLFLKDDTFIKLKPTIVNCLFGGLLLGGLAFNKLLLPLVLDSVFKLDTAGWRKLTIRWGLFFFVLAALNEVIWRTQTTDFWVAFKVWGVMPLTMIFALAQTPILLKHEIKPDTE